MPTLWTFPTNIDQYNDSLTDTVPWDTNTYPNLSHRDPYFLRATQPLSHIPNSFSGDRTMRTWYLKLTNFKNWNFDPTEELAGIQVVLKTMRGGRITDDTVQLLYNDIAVGENKADSDLNEIKYYGGKDSWGFLPLKANTSTNTLVTTESINTLTTSTFGVIIRFQSHPYWPSRETPMIDYVAVRGIYVTDQEDPTMPGTFVSNKDSPSERGKEDLKRGEEGIHVHDSRSERPNQPYYGFDGVNDAGYRGSSYNGSTGYTGSVDFYIGSEGGYVGSGYAGSNGYTGSINYGGPPPGYVGSMFPAIRQFQAVNNESQLPRPGISGIGFQIVNSGAIYRAGDIVYWDAGYRGYLYLYRTE
jgi:hypothetical protein